MQPRKYPRDIPNRPNYITIDIKDFGQTNWRIPSLIKATRILSLMQTSGVMEISETLNADGDLSEKLDKMPLILACQGALLGLCWYHQHQDLETKIDKFKDMSEFGENVFEELQEYGWELGHIQTCFVELIDRVVKSFVSQREVAEKVDFLSQNGETSN